MTCLLRLQIKHLSGITEYIHEMKDYGELLNFLKGAALRPHLELLTDRKDREQFLDAVLQNLRRCISDR